MRLRPVGFLCASVWSVLGALSACSQSSLDVELLAAAENGQSREVARLLEAGANPHARRLQNGKSVGEALDLAVRNGRKDVVGVFLDHGADLKDRNRALSVAAGSGHPEIVNFLLERGADINSGALVAAIRSSQSGIARMLLSRGADINSPAGGATPLIAASAGEDADLVAFLIKSGAKVNPSDGPGTTALIEASRFGKSPDIVRTLIRAGAILNATQADRTALHLASEYGPAAALVLVDAGADVNHRDHQGVTALMRAAHYGHLDVVRALIRAGAEVNAKGAYGYTALMDAAGGGHAEICNVLLLAKADKNAKNDAGEDAASVAERFKREDVARLLRSKGAM